LSLPLEQKAKQGERARPENDRFGSPDAVGSKQTAAGAIEAKAFEQQNVRRVEPVHLLVPADLVARSYRFRAIRRPRV
jgi:hypothetical protein